MTSVTAALTWRVTFGKYSGETLEAIADKEILYLDWLVDAKSLTDDQRKLVIDACEHFRSEIAAAIEEREDRRSRRDAEDF